jgi:ferredoxin/flavodoxin---NADP+ reductase
MPHVIIDTCTMDWKCVAVCQRKNIHPRQDEEQHTQFKQLFINPKRCLDCGSCAAACETHSIFPKDQVPPEKAYCIEKNAAYYRKEGRGPAPQPRGRQ